VLKYLLSLSLTISMLQGCSSAPKQVASTDSLRTCNTTTMSSITNDSKVASLTKVDCTHRELARRQRAGEQCKTRYRTVPFDNWFGEEFNFYCTDSEGSFTEGSYIIMK